MIKTISIVLGCIACAFLVFLVIGLGYIFYLMCISPDNCTACRGYELHECGSCIVHKHKLKRGEI